jgi:hypothetical protein
MCSVTALFYATVDNKLLHSNDFSGGNKIVRSETLIRFLSVEK